MTRAGRLDHTGATADFRAVLGEISEHLRVLDGLVRYRFGDDAEVMGAYTSARNVVGPTRSQKNPEAGGGTPAAA